MESKEMSGESGLMNEKAGYLARVSVFWLLVGGLLIFFGVAALLQRTGIWSATDADSAGDIVVILLGAVAIAHALKDDSKVARRESA